MSILDQFFQLKAKHPDAVLIFRCGDFYEMYEEDAVEGSKILGITLTKRIGDNTRMAGFPHHALDTYLPKLIRAGKRVAICDQLEDPKLTKKLVRRSISELVTPGIAPSAPATKKTVKTLDMIQEQYKKLLRIAFPSVQIFPNNTWNWSEVYQEDPYKNKRFMLIYNAYKSVSENCKRMAMAT